MKRYDKPMSAEQLAALPDETIDTSDIPGADVAWFADAEVTCPPGQERVTIRVDRDVLAYFQAQGRDVPSRMSAALRVFVSSQRDTSA